MLETQLARLENSELVRRLRDHELAYQFKHALVQDTARASLLNQERKRLHRLVGENLERLYPERRAELAPLLVEHFAEAGDEAKTFAYARMAGDAAARVNANTEALAQYTHALNLAPRLNVSSAPLQELFLKRGRVLEVKGDFGAALENYAEMSRAAETRGDRALELAAMMAAATIHSIPSSMYDETRARELNQRALGLARELGDKAAQAKILWNRMLAESRVGAGHRSAQAAGEEALQIARKNNLREQLAYVLNDLSTMLVFMGQAERGVAYNLEARAMWRELENLPMLSGNFCYAAMNHLILGEYDEAIAASNEGLRLAREINNRWNEAFAQTWIGEAYVERGEIETAERVMRTAIEVGADAFRPTHVMTQADLARLYGDLGDAQSGIDFAERAVAEADARFPGLRAWAVGALAHVLVLLGKLPSNLERAQELLRDEPVVDSSNVNPRYAIDTTQARIELLLANKEFAQALELSGRMLAYLGKNKFRQHQCATLQLRAEAWIGLENWQEAANVLQAARALAETLNARWSLWQVLALLARVQEKQGNWNDAQMYRDQARVLIDSIAARTPENLRAGFLKRAHGRASAL